MNNVVLTTAFLFLGLGWVVSTKNGNGCGYQTCPKWKDDKINVHIVSHTHDDMGWLKTVDQYYYGSKNTIQNAGVQYILDSVVQELIHDPNKKFIYVETGFFWRWWREQDDHLRHQVKGLVNSGQLEFIGGGWCMNDEATTHYNDIIDQMTWGFRMLNDTFGECGRPRVAWQIDPFGHSREQASLFAQMYFDGLFLGRIDYQDKFFRQTAKNMEFVWKGSANLGKDGELFTGVLPNTYSPPSGLCFDIFCADEPIMDDPRLKDYNVQKRVQQFVDAVKSYSAAYATNHVIVTMGNDFNYQNAHSWFKNLDKLIKHTNDMQSNFNVFYSTPSCYLFALNNANRTWSTKEDDFFPYASDPHAYWTGYFTSRPALKKYVRDTNNFLQVCKQLDSLARLDSAGEGNVDTLREAQAVAQHHDAVSGTEKQVVAYDYAERLAVGVADCEIVVNEAYKKIMPLMDVEPPTQVFCNLLNISQCEITESNKPVAVTIYNPLAREVSHFARFPVTGKAYKVMDPKGQPVKAQLVPIPEGVLRIPGRKSKATMELVFPYTLPPLGFTTFFVRPSNNMKLRKEQRSFVDTLTVPSEASIHNNKMGLVVDKNGFIKEIIPANEPARQVGQTIIMYTAMSGNNTRFDLRASGAYIFRPNGSQPLEAFNATVTVVKGHLVQEIHQKVNDWISQTYRFYQNSSQLENDWVVGPIPVKDGVGKEIVMRYEGSIFSHDEFYTDANGRETLKRSRNKRPTWKLNVTEPISDNYYPINSHIYIKGQDNTGDEVQMSVLVDRAQGGASLQNGNVELMVHRRLLYDDGFGVDEALNEGGYNGEGLVVRGQHYVMVKPIATASKIMKSKTEFLFMQPWTSFAYYNGSEQDWISRFCTEFAGLQRSLPDNVHLLTLEQWKGGMMLLRLEHRFEEGEDPELSKPVTFSFKDIFTTFNATNLIEMTLGANQILSSAERLKWNSQFEHRLDSDLDREILPSAMDITLNPMQIRTFLFKPHKNWAWLGHTVLR